MSHVIVILMAAMELTDGSKACIGSVEDVLCTIECIRVIKGGYQTSDWNANCTEGCGQMDKPS
jgi:hypothetical protein